MGNWSCRAVIWNVNTSAYSFNVNIGYHLNLAVTNTTSPGTIYNTDIDSLLNLVYTDVPEMNPPDGGPNKASLQYDDAGVPYEFLIQ